jgi:hypothetical protein
LDLEKESTCSAKSRKTKNIPWDKSSQVVGFGVESLQNVEN